LPVTALKVGVQMQRDYVSEQFETSRASPCPNITFTCLIATITPNRSLWSGISYLLKLLLVNNMEHHKINEADYQANIAKSLARVKSPLSAALLTSNVAEVYLVPAQQRWADSCRAAPNLFFRTSLFQAKNKTEKRAYLLNETISSLGLGNVHIKYTGYELRQDDQKLWLHIMHLARLQSLEKAIMFTPAALCKAIGWNLGGKSYIRIRESLSRLKNTSLTVCNTSQNSEVTFPLILDFSWIGGLSEKPLKKYEAKIAKELIGLYSNKQYTRISSDFHLKLPVGMATWLHGFYSTHKNPFPSKIESIRRASGMTTLSVTSATQTIANALSILKDKKFLSDFKIEDGLVRVVRNPAYSLPSGHRSTP